MALMYRDMTHALHEYILCIFHNGWMNCFSCCSLPTLLCNGQNLAEYEAYWLMGFPIINLWGARFTSLFSVFSVMAGWIAEILLLLSSSHCHKLNN